MTKAERRGQQRKQRFPGSGRWEGLPEHNAVVFDEHVDIRAVLNTKLHEHILGPVVPQGPGMLPEEELRWGFIAV